MLTPTNIVLGMIFAVLLAVYVLLIAWGTGPHGTWFAAWAASLVGLVLGVRLILFGLGLRHMRREFIRRLY